MPFTWIGTAIAVICVLYGGFGVYWVLTGQYGPVFEYLDPQGVEPREFGRALNEAGFMDELGEQFRTIAFGVTLGVLTEISRSVKKRSTGQTPTN